MRKNRRSKPGSLRIQLLLQFVHYPCRMELEMVVRGKTIQLEGVLPPVALDNVYNLEACATTYC